MWWYLERVLIEVDPAYRCAHAGYACYALLHVDDRVQVSTLVAAAARNNMPLTVIDLHANEDAKRDYAEALVMVRPDQHIAWRGATVPADPDGRIALLTGAAKAKHKPVFRKDRTSAMKLDQQMKFN